jgi:hypothetical protein
MGRIYHARGTDAGLADGCTWFEKSLDAYRRLEQTPPLDAQTAAALEAITRDSARCR